MYIMYIFVIVNVLLNIRVKYDSTRIVPSTQATQATLCCLWRIVTAQAGIAPSDACWFTHTWNRAAWGYVFLIPTSGRRLGITGGRCLPLAFRHSGTHTHDLSCCHTVGWLCMQPCGYLLLDSCTYYC